MTPTTPSSGTAAPDNSPKKRKIGKILAIVGIAFVVLIAAGYFVATSSAFFKSVILPRAGDSMGAEITVSDASISPFSQIVLRNLEVKPRGKETLLKADAVRARYNLRDIISGKITVDELSIDAPVITIVEAADGSSNLDPLTEEALKETAEGDSEDKTDKPTVLNIRNLSLKNATVTRTKTLPEGGTEVANITGLNLSINQLANGQPGKLSVAAALAINNAPKMVSTNSAAGTLAANVSGTIDYKLTDDLQPETAAGGLRLQVNQASGAMAELANLAAILDCDLSPTEIRKLSLRFEQGGQNLGELRASGPFSFAKQEGRLNLEIASIDRQVLNLLGAAQGADFNSTLINSTNVLVLANAGNSISFQGGVNVSKFSITQKKEDLTTPVIDLQTSYQLTADQTAKTAVIQSFNITGRQNQQDFLLAGISQPMAISWGGASATPEEATLAFNITNLNLADWKALAKEMNPSGQFNAQIQVRSQQGGQRLALNVASRLDNFSATLGSNQIDRAEIDLAMQGTVAEMKNVAISNLTVRMAQAGQTALNLASSGSIQVETQEMDLQARAQGDLAQLFKLVVMPGLTATAGQIQFDGRIAQSKDTQVVKGNFALADWSGSYAGSPVTRYNAQFEADIEKKGQEVEIRQLAGNLSQAGQAGGKFDVKGEYNLAGGTGDLELKIDGMNQHALRPFLAEALGEKQLITISLDGAAKAKLGENASNVDAELSLKNLVVRDPNKAENDAPLSALLKLDGGLNKEVLKLKLLQVTLSPTARARNQLNVTGQLDFSKTNALTGNLVIEADTFDVTPFYDLYAAQPTAPAGSAKAPQQAPTQPGAANAPANPVEPEPMNLPVERLTAEIKIGQFYLREIEIKDWRGQAQITGSRVQLNPFELSLNDAPVKATADLNLGVRGYVYDIAASIGGVQLEPLANSFVLEERGGFKKGDYKGTVFANLKLKGAGTTGVNLRKNLDGEAGFTFTNANLQIVSPKYKGVLVPISLALQIPEIAQSPIQWLDTRLLFGEGVINITNFAVVSDSYRATAHGVVPIADVLTNSPLQKIPVNLEIRKALAERGAKLGLAGGQTSADGQYVKLPPLVRLEGTLGAPKSEIDKKGLATLALQASGGLIGGDAGKVLRGLGGILGGNTTTNTPGTTNQPAGTNNAAPGQPTPGQKLINDAFDLFKKKKN